MRLTQLPLATLKEVPADAEIISHQLMLRAGLMRRLSSGLFTWMPLGLRVLRKVEQIVREEMDRAGALEMLMPAVQPAELWQETGRWDVYGDLLLRIRDRHERDYCFAPTAEEVVTDIARRELRSYKQLPVTYYQINTKFRDEIRPRFGVMRAREFIMKDAYSFHLDQASLETTYDRMADCVLADLHPPGFALSQGRRRRRRDRRLLVAGIPRAGRLRRGPYRLVRRRQLRSQCRNGTGGSAGHATSRCHAHTRARANPGRPLHRRGRRVSQGRTPAMPQDPGRGRQRGWTRGTRCCGATTNSTR